MTDSNSSVLDTATNRITTDLTERDIHEAFDNDWFEVFYQPQVSLCAENRVLGAEAFVRLRHPTLGYVFPGVVLPLVHEMDLMLELTKVVLTKVLEHWAEFKKNGFDLKFSINVDYALLNNKTLNHIMTSLLKEFDVPRRNINLEISNSKMQSPSEELLNAISQLRIDGFSLSLDDYGFPSKLQERLSELPIDEIKIHRDIIAEIRKNDNAQQQVRNALYIADKLGMRVVAIGVESKAEANWLMRQGCDSAQGFLFGKPMSYDDFRKQVYERTRADELARRNQREGILIVVRDGEQRHLLVDVLSDLYHVHTARTVEDAKLIYDAYKPSVIVLDLFLPDASGVELCDSIKNSPNAKEFSSLFISGEESLQERLDAYEAGATDFISRPFSTTELVAKLGRVVSYQEKKRQLEEQAREYQQVAKVSMSEAASYGEVMQLFVRMLRCDDEKGMAEEIFSFMNKNELLCSIQFHGSDSAMSFDQQSAVCSPIEMNVFDVLRDKGRIYQFGNRMIINDRHLSILVKRLPEDDEKQGRIRDYLAFVIEGLEARYLDILRQRVVQSVFHQLEHLSDTLVNAMNRDYKDKQAIMERFSLELSMSFHTLDLSEEQEKYLSKIVEGMMDAKMSSEVNAREMLDNLTKITALLSNSIEEYATEKPLKECDTLEGDDSVELF